MTGYYVVVDGGPPYKSEDFELPPNMTQDDVIIFVHGLMFEDNWCPGTDHAIFVDTDEDPKVDGSGYVSIHEDNYPSDTVVPVDTE